MRTKQENSFARFLFYRLKKSAECFHCEAELSNEYTVCDNISLETIVIEFEIFYYQRFKAHPHLCKMISPHVPVTKANRSCNESKKVILKKCTTEPIVSHLESLNTSQKYDTTADSKSKVSADEDLTIWKEYQDVILQVRLFRSEMTSPIAGYRF